MATTKEWVDEVLDPKMTYQQSQDMYSKWAKAGSYEEMLKSHQTVYAGPFTMSEKMKQLFPNPDNLVLLDLGAGTGMVAEELHKLGFKTIDALEPCQEFLETLRKKNIHRRILDQCVGGDTIVDAPSDHYDAIVTVGTFCPGHIPCDALHELIRIIKPGGYFVNCMRESFLTVVPEYNNRLEPLMEKLEKEGKWKKVAWEKYDNHFLEEIGIIMVFQIC